MAPFKILVAVDFSDSADRALAQALALAAPLKGELIIAHVAIPKPVTPTDVVSAAPIDMEDAQRARTALGEMVALAKTHGVEARLHLLAGSVVFGLLDAIDELNPNLVVVGSHGKGVLRRALMGSVSESLCRRSSVPVLVVPCPRRQWAAHRAAWSCSECGHILDKRENTEKCTGCGIQPVRWLSAPITHDPADIDEASVADSEGDHLTQSQSQSTQGSMVTSVGGTQGTDVNPELRVRY